MSTNIRPVNTSSDPRFDLPKAPAAPQAASITMDDLVGFYSLWQPRDLQRALKATVLAEKTFGGLEMGIVDDRGRATGVWTSYQGIAVAIARSLGAGEHIDYRDAADMVGSSRRPPGVLGMFVEALQPLKVPFPTNHAEAVAQYRLYRLGEAFAEFPLSEVRANLAKLAGINNLAIRQHGGRPIKVTDLVAAIDQVL